MNKTRKEYVPELGMEVTLIADFPVVAESLSRMGLKIGNMFYQEFFILVKRDRFYIVHYKDLRLLDNEEVDVYEDDEDYNRIRSAISLLESWELISTTEENKFDRVEIDVLSVEVKNKLNMKPRYSFGN